MRACHLNATDLKKNYFRHNYSRTNLSHDFVRGQSVTVTVANILYVFLLLNINLLGVPVFIPRIVLSIVY